MTLPNFVHGAKLGRGGSRLVVGNVLLASLLACFACLLDCLLACLLACDDDYDDNDDYDDYDDNDCYDDNKLFGIHAGII